MPSAFENLSGTHQLQVTTIAHAAATATEYVGVIQMPHAARVTAVRFHPFAAVTGADTNSTNLNVDTLVSTTAAEIANVDLASGTDLAAKTTATLGSSLTTELAAGDRVALECEKVGTGLDVPAGTFIVEYQAI